MGRMWRCSSFSFKPRLVIFRADGSSPDRTLGQLDIGHVTALCAAPVGDQVLLANHRNELLLVDLAAETLRVLDRSDYGRLEDSDLVNGIAWSPDGRWAAYEQAIRAQQVILKLCRLGSGETYQVTDAVRRGQAIWHLRQGTARGAGSLLAARDSDGDVNPEEDR